MSLFDLIVVGVVIVIVFALLRANDVLGNNPHQQVKALEDLTGPFTVKTSFAERLRLNSLYGISPTNPRRAWWLAVAVVLFLLVLLLIQQ